MWNGTHQKLNDLKLTYLLYFFLIIGFSYQKQININ